MGSNHQSNLLTVSLTSVFRPNERTPSFNFQKIRWEDSAFYFYSYRPSAKEFSPLFLSFAAATFFTSLTLNVAKSSIPFGRIKRQFQVWWFAKVEKAVCERRKASAAAQRMKIIRLTSLLFDMSRLSLPRPRLRHCRQLALLSLLNLILNLCILSFVLSLVLLPHLPSLQTPQLSLSERVDFGLSRLPKIPLFCLTVKGSA